MLNESPRGTGCALNLENGPSLGVPREESGYWCPSGAKHGDKERSYCVSLFTKCFHEHDHVPKSVKQNKYVHSTNYLY